MANKEEVIFKVKAELAGFKKSMEDLKKVAKDSSKNIEKAMSMDLTDEGSKAGKSFAKGMNKELKSVTNALKNELKIMSDKTYTIKVKLDSSSVDRIKRDLSNIEIRVSASASGRASSSMNNNANAPNSQGAVNTMASMANTAALANLVTEVNKVAKTIQTTVTKITENKIEVETKNAKVGVDVENVKVGVDVEGVKVGVDTEHAKVGVDTDGVNVGVDTSNIQGVELKVQEIQPIEVKVDTKDAKVGVDAKNAKVGVDTYDTKVGVDVKGVKVGVDTKDARVKIDENSLSESVIALNGALNSLIMASSHIKEGADAIADIISKATDLKEAIEDAFNNGAKAIGEEIYESFSKSAQELYKDITDLYKMIASRISEANKNKNTYTTKAREPRVSNTIPPLSFGPFAHDFDTKKLKEAGKEFRSIQDIIGDVAKSTRETSESFKDAQSSINDVAKTVQEAIKGISKSTEKNNQKETKRVNESYDSLYSNLIKAFDYGAKTIGTEIYEAFTKSAQELYQDIVELYKILAKKMNESSKNQNSNTTTKSKSNNAKDVDFGSISWNEQQKIKQRSPFEAPNSRTPFTKTADLGNQYALFEIDKIKNADKAFQDIQTTISEVSKSMKEMLKEFSESIKQISDTIKKAFANDNHNQIDDNQKAKADSINARRKNKDHSFSSLSESEKINQQIEQWKNRIKSLKESISKTTDNDKIAKYEASIAKIGNTIGTLNAKLEELKHNGFDEMCMTIEEANGAVSKLKMNLQLLAGDSDDSESNADDHVKRIRKEADDIHEQISKLIDYRFKVFDKECEDRINNSFSKLMDAIEQGAKAMDAIIQKYGSNPLGEGKFDKESHAKVYDARENLKSKYNDFRDVIDPPEMGWYVTKEFEKEVNEITNNVYKKLNDTINELEKSPSLIHADTVAENVAKLIEKAMKIEGDEEYTSSYKNRTTFNKLLDQLEKSMDDISEDDIPKHQEEAWKELRELLNVVRENIESIFKPMADDIFRKQKEQIEQMKVDADESYGSEAIRKGLNDVFKKLEEQKDKERRINKSKETVDEFDREFVKPLISDINKSSSSGDVKHDYTQAINRIVERMNEAFGKDTHKETVQEFEAALRQLEDRMENAPVKDVTKDIIKHIINRMREQIENAYEAYNLDLEVNLPIRSSLDVPAVINSIREQMDDVEQYVENNINLPIRSSLDVPDIRRNLDVIEVEFREIGETSDSLRDKLRGLFSVFGTKNAHVATHFVGQFKDKLNQLKESAKKVSDSIKDIGTPFKKAFNGISGIINKIISPIKKVTSGFRDMGNEAKTASSKVNGLTGSFKGLLGKLAMMFGIREIFSLFKEGTKDAMKYEASIMNLQRTFGKASQSLIDFANKQAVAFGISKKQVAEYGNIFSVIMKDVNRAMMKGQSSDAIAKQTMSMSQGLLEAAGSISSALGYDVETVLEGLRSGLLGSSEAVDQYGLALKDANLKQSETFRQLQQQTGVESWEKLTEAQKQYVRTQEIINQATAKYGKMMQNTATLHNRFIAQWQNTKLAIGNLGKVIWTAILPPLTKILAVLEVIFNYAASAMTSVLKMFGIDVSASFGNIDSGELENSLGGIDDTATDTSDSLNSVGDSAQDTAKDTEDAAKKIKRALAGFDQINVLSLGEDEESKDPKIPKLDDWNPTFEGIEIGTPEIEDKAKELSDKLKTIFKDLLEPFKAAWDELGDRWISAWNRLKDSFKNFCDSLGDFLASVWRNGGKEFVQHMAEIALAVGIAAMEIGGTILDSLAKLWKHLDPETNMNTKGFIDALNEVSVKIRDLILDLNTHFESLMLNGGQDVLNALGDMFMNLGEAAVRGIGVVVDAIDGLLDHLDPATNKKTQGALGGLEYLFKSIGQFALGLTDAFATFMDNGGQDFLNNMGDIVMILIDMAATITGDLLNAITAFFDSWAGHVVITVAGRALELVSSILKGLLEILEPLTPVISAVVAGIGAFMVASKITTAVTTIVSAFQNLGPILGIAKAGFSALWAVLAANPVAAIIALIVAIGVALVALYNKCEWFRDAVNKVFDRIREPLEKLKEAFSEIIESVVNIFQDFIDIIVGIFTGDGERVGKAVRDMIENVINIFKNLWKFRQALAELAFNLILGLVEGIWECIKNLPKLLVGIGEFIVDFFKGLLGEETVEKIKQIGRDIIDGLCQGIMSAINAIEDAFKAIWDAIKQGIDNITSAEWWSDLWDAITKPFIDAKDFIVQVFSDMCAGIKEWLDNIKDAISEAWSNIKDTFSDIASSILEIFGGLIEGLSEAWDSIKESFSNMVSSISEYVGDLAQTIGEKWDNIKDVVSERVGIATKNASEKWQDLTDELSGMLDDFIERNKERWERIKQDTAEKVRPIVDETVEKYSEMKDSVSTKLDELMVISEERWGEIKEKIMEVLSPIIDYYKNQWEYIKKMTADIADATCQVLGEIWDNTVGVLKAAWENMTDFVIEKSDYIKTMVCDIADATNEVLSEIWNNTVGVLQAAWENMSLFAMWLFDYMRTMVCDIANATNEVLKEIWENTTGVLQAAWEGMSEFAIGAFEYIKTMVSDIAEATNEVLGEIWNNTIGVLEAAWEGMSEFAVGAFEYIKTMVCDIAEATNEVLKTIWENTTGVLSAAWDGMSEFAIGVFEDIKTMVCDIADATIEVLSEIWNNAVGVLGAAWDNFSETCIGVFEYIKTMACDITNATIEVLSEIWNNTTGVLGAAWDNFSETCIGVFEYIKTMVSDITEATVEVLSDIWGNITGVLGAAWDGITDLVGDWVKGICDTIFDGFIVLPAMMKDLFNVDVFGFIKDALDKGLDLLKGAGGIGEKAIAVGRFLIEGLCDGIVTGVKAIGTFLSGVGDIIIGFFKDLFGIHSPSKVFAELGGFLIEGLAQGITDSIAMLENIFSGISDVISGAWDKIEVAWSGASDFFGGVWQSVKDTFDKIKDMSIPKPKIEWDIIKETASKTVGKIKETVERFKADLPKPSVVWDSVKTTAERTISNVKDSVERFKAKLPKPELSWSDLKTTLTDTLDKLKETISKFKWELPKPKLPSFSVSGGKAPWGFMGQGSLPSIKVKWNAQGGIMNSPTIFGMTGNTLLGGGEAGAEAILPLDELWNRLDNSFQQQNQALSRAIASSNNGSNRPVNVVLKVNDIEMGKVVVNSLKSLSNHSGGSLDLPFNK